ncbi:hypothetical protein GI584_00100 [Gracilibacillus salitolerans]|uniref:Uncharacterized protein n=1 Tax=Gracilibacillus salitolerans TaxID=2663022 RepID=A0A5Q2TF83_9BACI|nr:hypothetical protein [Gracilibacillus salitolerans]QGH32580.1 hypothetical protein GI584_00100 [Gracilibacillus salitolerans]
MTFSFKNREKVFKFLDHYSNDMKEQIDINKTKQPLLKSYIFETFNREINEDLEFDISSLESLINNEYGTFKQIDECLYSIIGFNKFPFGFIEIVNDRFFVLYALEKSSITDQLFSKIIKSSSLIDNLWISGKMFDGFLTQIAATHHPQRYIKMNFEYSNIFNSLDEEGYIQSDYIDFDFEEDRVTKINLSKELAEIKMNLPEIRNLLPEFNSIGLLKFPTRIGKGGHDFYRNGKVTNRSNSFKDHRYQITNNINYYKNITEDLENNVWLNFENISAPSKSESLNFNGLPVSFKFSKKLNESTFNKFVDVTFRKGQEPFKIIGNPIRLNNERVHVYGTDLHLWQEVILDLSCDEFIMFLPRGTCGNTIHRMVTNIQRYLDPAVTITIGNIDYESYINKYLEVLPDYE